MAVIKLLVAVTHRIIAGTWPVFGNEAWYIMIAALLISTWVQSGEEIGWRGFALPRMSEKLGLPAATLVLGLLWACWHLPLFFLRQADAYGQSFPMYALQVTALSVAMGWLYWQTKGRLLLVMLMHAAVNNTKDIVPSATTGATDPFALSHSLVGWLTVVLMWILAGYFLVHLRGVRMLRF